MTRASGLALFDDLVIVQYTTSTWAYSCVHHARPATRERHIMDCDDAVSLPFLGSPGFLPDQAGARLR